MEKHSELTDTVLLLDNYGEDSEMLHRSFRRAGFKGPVIVIEDDGFFPEDVISVWQYFCGDFQKGGKVPGKARYFNQINVPDYWEISGNNSSGKVQDLHRERGRIFYAEPKHKRLVRVVDWLDEKGTVRSSDHYNRYGALYARTFFSKDGKRFCKTYFDAEGRETVLENFVTHDIILNRDGKVYVFKSKVDLILLFLKEQGAMRSRIFFNSLSTPLFVSERMPADRQGDILFWQEGARNDIPGNMQMILGGRAKRVKRIFVQKKESYEKLIELGASDQVLKPLGFAYAYSRQNTFRNEALICTNSDRIEKCEELIKALPQMNFHIAAVTEMSSKLMSLSQYQNVTLYPGARTEAIDKLFDTCDYYLDINHEAEIVSAVKQAFLHNHLILGFNQTLHNRTFIAKEHIFDNYEAMAAFLHKVMGQEEMINSQIDLQKKTAMSEETAAYADLLK
ncbi:MAG: accessory Sec system glycosylation chaperone GtfB [bacterium]|nr:accessory Sec system glycosylation chaperone GtfB [bacterium]